ncbi:preprotein translocase subunit SecA [candidate division KSB1 bacterium]|nr:MAG: preprotein translocase subunit SecA [candidate division KSB1 bacterium]RKY85368.1 MAG: preprotein translocase subunit SecA [candidate division KSB1 bacterium]
MLTNIITKIFGSKHEREIKKIKPIVEQINQLYEEYHQLSDAELRALTDKFKAKINDRVSGIRDEIQQLKSDLEQSYKSAGTAEERNEIRNRITELEDQELYTIDEVLDEILPEAYAAVKETCRRLVGKSWEVVGHKITWDMIPFDVQLIGAVVLHQGKIAEMATGEGKTLVATMPLYLNALPGKGVHLVTVNDYLARRDAEWMGKIYEFLGLSVAYITNDMDTRQRKTAYSADITYGTNNEFGFDYLRDNMAVSLEEIVQREHYYAIVDEVDSVLIDEARTPLIISGPVGQSTQQYRELKPAVERLVKNQTILVNRIVAEAEKLLAEGKEYEAGVKLLQAQRGAPKNKRLAKLLQEVGIKKLIQRVENDFLRDKRLHEIDEDLYFSIDERSNTIELTDKGRSSLAPDNSDMFVLPDLDAEIAEIEANEGLSRTDKERMKEKVYREYGEKSERVHNVAQLLKAYQLFTRDEEYVVSDGKVMIVDEFTGRLMPGRRYSDGLHQALEAKENVKIEGETQTFATITLQNYFRLYYKLAGMTGTAETEAHEFYEIYKLDVVVIPTNRPVRRVDYQDQIFRTKREKYNAVINEIVRMHEMGRPVLVGTISVDVSETLSRMLKRRGIPHSVLNAKYHKQEAEIIAHAGEPGAVTIATNMAGRGTDIKLGTGVVRCDECYLIDREKQAPSEVNIRECYENMPCGLHIIGTERHEARRIDRQLRGRAGRQGDPGSSRFYLSLEDDLMRLFGSDRIAGVMDRLGIQEGEVIQHPMITRSIERAQKKVEMQNFSIRKHLLEYDDVMNQQRTVIYDRRSHALREENLKDEIMEMIDDFVEKTVLDHTDPKAYPEDWDWEGLKEEFTRVMWLELPFKPVEIPELQQQKVIERIREHAYQVYEWRESQFGPDWMRLLERRAILWVIDERWKEHLYEMDMLKEGIGLRAYGQKDPLLEYKQEAFRMFTEMLDRINEGVLQIVFKAQPTAISEDRLQHRRPAAYTTIHESATGMGLQGVKQAEEEPVEVQTATRVRRKPIRVTQKIGRNDPCPCGSGKKYKYCCGR